VENSKNCAARKVQHHHIWRFLLVRGLQRTLLISGLGVEEKPNGIFLNPTRTACDFFFWNSAKEFTDQDQEFLMYWSNKICK